VQWWQQLAEYEMPAMDVATDGAILDCVNRRKASFPDSNV
jgi:trimethylamine--corrinoid protein Co-methyltransferase